MPTPPGRRPRRTEPRRALSQGLIVRTAVAVLDAEGLDAVTMRRVAQELGTGPASLYAHVGSKDELYELMLDHVLGEVELPARVEPERWQEQMKEVSRASRAVLSAHRDIARVSLASLPTGPNTLAIGEFRLALMRAGGIPPRVAALAIDTLGMLVDADVIEDSIILAKTPPGEDPWRAFREHIAEIRRYLEALPPDRFPNIVGMAEELTAEGGDGRFEFGLDILVRGIASYAEDG
ncbi:TetR/AcrR family transcriptional regulator [Actinomadura sp. PM05-2]|uniref:TetR/AcrR family transcriptional regulator n=2 Tax=Actinomadura parmotrematis TaxID=2864039 RepID=A0ABS7FPB5_9ACTN|nr:TetR/AcrR family transcriptional regulator [Actinomadura parmotrematis]